MSLKFKLWDKKMLSWCLLTVAVKSVKVIKKETSRKEVKITYTRVLLSMLCCCPKNHCFSRKFRSSV